MIVVMGATGTVGGALVAELSAREAEFKAVVRDPTKAAEMFGPGVALATADLSDPPSLSVALKGCTRLFLLTAPGTETVAQTSTAVEAAQRSGVQHIVKLSALGTDHDAPFRIGRWHAAAEDVVRDSGTAWTILQPGSFMQNLLMSADSIRERGEYYAARGDGRQALIDARDIAAAAAVVLTEPAAHAGLTHELTGGEAISDEEIATALSEATGRPVRYVDVPPEAAAAGMRAGGVPEWLVDDLVLLDRLVAEGHVANVIPTLGELLGRAPRSITDFARDYAAAFGG